MYALTANPDLAAPRQRQVVDRMVTCGYYTEVQAQETLAAGMSEKGNRALGESALINPLGPAARGF